MEFLKRQQVSQPIALQSQPQLVLAGESMLGMGRRQGGSLQCSPTLRRPYETRGTLGASCEKGSGQPGKALWGCGH